MEEKSEPRKAIYSRHTNNAGENHAYSDDVYGETAVSAHMMVLFRRPSGVGAASCIGTDIVVCQASSDPGLASRLEAPGREN